ncbi:putative CAP domain-containing protein [Helianthus annuus]|nr:putative CAP domain-containing protein [Helianthus annuus]
MGFSRKIALVLALCMAILHFSHEDEQSCNQPEDYSINTHSGIRRVLSAAPSTGTTSQQAILDAHNKVRKEIPSLEPMTWNATVAKFAEEYASERKKDCALQHSDTQIYGENIATGAGKMTILDAINMWCSEKDNYDYETNTCGPGKACGHYTQVIWKNSTTVGCALSHCVKNDGIFIICNYYPPGNYIDTKPY